MSDSANNSHAAGGAESASVAEAPGLALDEDKVAEATRERIRRLPPEVGAVLITVGIAGVILPGPVGMPLLLAGGLALMPSVFGRAERWVERRFPTLHWHGIKNVNRFIDDFEKRYPPDVPKNCATNPESSNGTESALAQSGSEGQATLV